MLSRGVSETITIITYRRRAGRDLDSEHPFDLMIYSDLLVCAAVLILILIDASFVLRKNGTLHTQPARV